MTHPVMIGTEAATCSDCYERTYGVALDNAWMNMQDSEGVDPTDANIAEEWARWYVENGDATVYYCTRHDPVNAEWWRAHGHDAETSR